MRAEVWFVKKEVLKTSGFGIWSILPEAGFFKPNWPADYYKVAEVEDATPEICFSLLQNTDSPWVEDTRVVAYVKNERSMSVDDVVVIDGEAKMCASIDWEIIVPKKVKLFDEP